MQMLVPNGIQIYYVLNVMMDSYLLQILHVLECIAILIAKINAFNVFEDTLLILISKDACHQTAKNISPIMTDVILACKDITKKMELVSIYTVIPLRLILHLSAKNAQLDIVSIAMGSVIQLTLDFVPLDNTLI